MSCRCTRCRRVRRTRPATRPLNAECSGASEKSVGTTGVSVHNGDVTNAPHGSHRLQVRHRLNARTEDHQPLGVVTRQHPCREGGHRCRAKPRQRCAVDEGERAERRPTEERVHRVHRGQPLGDVVVAHGDHLHPRIRGAFGCVPHRRHHEELSVRERQVLASKGRWAVRACERGAQHVGCALRRHGPVDVLGTHDA